MEKSKTFFVEVIAETKKVTWPTFKEVRDTTIVVIIAVFIFGIFLYLVDLALGEIIKNLFKSCVGEKAYVQEMVCNPHIFRIRKQSSGCLTEKRVTVFGLEDQVGQILIPTQKVLEVKSGKKVETEKKFYPGYILVEIEMSDDVWHVGCQYSKSFRICRIGKNTRLRFLMMKLNKMVHQISSAAEKPVPKFIFDKGETIKIIDGPFSNFTGQVEEVNPVRSTLKVMVTIFGRALQWNWISYK